MFPRWKAALAAVIAAILAWSGALTLVGWYQPAQQADLAVQDQKAVQPVDLPILMYHHIHKSSSQWGDHVVSPQTLEGDFQYLTAQGYTAVTVADLTAYTQNGTPLPEKPIMITFDDGQLSVLEYALPLLERYDLKAVVAEIIQAGGRAWPITADLTEEDQVQGMVDQVMEKYGRIDILVNNAGGYPKEMYDISTQSPLKIWDWKPEQWDQIIRTNLRIPFLCMNKVTPVMRDQGFGDIVSVSSRMGRIASEMGAYAVAKGGIVTLTKTAAIQMKEYGVRCNAVAPTIVDTPGQRVYNTSVGQDGIQMGDARHVALAVRYLLCDAPPVMTGQVMDLFTTL